MPAIEVNGLSMHYGDLRAVDDVSFTVGEGEFFGILGPNGAGKTTTLEIIEGLRRPTSGEVRLLGESPWPRNAGLLPRIGVQLQASAFFERLTAREQLHTFASLYGVPGREADAWLERVGLSDKADTRAEDLSGGQAQRLSIACALVHDPELVFLDEPTAALDPQARRNLWDLLSSLNETGRTVVLTTHYMDEAETLCDRVGIMDGGRILRLDTPSALIRGLDAPTRVVLGHRDSFDSGSAGSGGAAGSVGAAGSGGAIAELSALPGVERVDAETEGLVVTSSQPAALLTWLAQREALEGIQVRGATLEDVFLDLTGREYRA